MHKYYLQELVRFEQASTGIFAAFDNLRNVQRNPNLDTCNRGQRQPWRIALPRSESTISLHGEAKTSLIANKPAALNQFANAPSNRPS